MVADRGSLDNGARTNVNIVTNFHGVIIEGTPKGFIRWSIALIQRLQDEYPYNAPHDTSFTNETISSKLNNDGMAWTCSSEVSAYDSSARNDGLSAKDNILWACDGCPTRDLVTRVLEGVLIRQRIVLCVD